jgi:hypothetical protein
LHFQFFTKFLLVNLKEKMPGKKKSLKIKFEAEKDFCGGMTLREITEKYEIAMRTVKSWYTGEHWKEKRARVKSEVQESNVVKLIDAMTTNTCGWISSASMISAMVQKICKDIRDGQTIDMERIRQLEYGAELCGRVTKLAVEIQSRAMPEGQQQVLVKFIQDVDALKEKVSGDVEEQI